MTPEGEGSRMGGALELHDLALLIGHKSFTTHDPRLFPREFRVDENGGQDGTGRAK
jgi:hypothetical protein